MVFSAVYGSREQDKVWPFKFCGTVSTRDGSLKGGDPATGVCTECRYDWGTVENHVWQGHAERVELAAGPATLRLVVDHGLSPPGTAPRNIDAVVLYSNISDVNRRLHEGSAAGNTPFDGMLTQRGDAYLRCETAPAHLCPPKRPPSPRS